MNNKIDLSVIIPLTEKDRHDDIRDLYYNYKEGVVETGLSYEIIFVIDGDFPTVFEMLQNLKKQGEKIKISKLARWFGESTSLTVGFEQSRGDIILTLPAYQQMEGSEIPKLLDALKGYDLVIGCRWPRKDNIINRIQSRAFHRIVKLFTGFNFKDLGSGVRVMRRKVIEEVNIYGDQHRFLPLLASRYGFKVGEVDVKQSEKDIFTRVYSAGIYTRRILDLISVFFLIKFTKKPLRFFGLSGSFIFAFGTLLSLILFVQRVFFAVPLADRPIVLLALFLIVLGIQILAIGLVGEIVIFTHAKELKEYTVEEVLN
jgi:glycosyltransferase involved in cell wall biosynthesis